MATAAAVVGRTNSKPRDTDRRPRRRFRRVKKNRAAGANMAVGEGTRENAGPDPHSQVEVEYVPEKADLDVDDPLLGVFTAIFEKYSFTVAAAAKGEANEKEVSDNAAMKKGSDVDYGEQDAQKKKQLQRMKIAELKQICNNPDAVEVWDATVVNPKLLVYLKSYRNTVPVPRHWSRKRKFLQGKRGIAKRPFQLPDFIAATGVEKMRQAYIEKENSKRLKQKHYRMQPKMGKMDIDYQVLHDAFFKYQTKPTLTSHGDLYYEGKEFELKLREMKPGMLSRELKNALGMPDGAPPPWLKSMQLYGPPPSYPCLKIPGLEAPVSPGDTFGDALGEWGKPPTGEEEPLDRSKHWGELEEEEEEEEEEVEQELMEDEEIEGIRSVDTISSTPAGAETPDVIDLRKSQPERQTERLYQVLEQKERIATATLSGSIHTYVYLTKPIA